MGQSLGVLLLVLLALAGLKLRRKPRATVDLFHPNLDNDKALHVRGWSNDEMSKILADFSRMCDLPQASSPRIQASPDGTLTVSFPQDIDSSLFSYLVNYTQYPKGLSLKNRDIGVAGVATLTQDFGVPEPSLVGQKAVIYVPTDDREHDEVFVRVGDSYFKNSFASSTWVRVSAPRLPDFVKQMR